MIPVLSYLIAIIIANLSVTVFGKEALFITAFLIIPFDLLARDVLHDKWKHNFLWLRLFALILTGGLLSFVLNTNSWQVGLGSCLAFLAAGTTNTIVYELVYHWKRLYRMNFSNLFACTADSTIFISIVFGFNLQIIATQSAIKFFGGILWSVSFLYWRKRCRKQN